MNKDNIWNNYFPYKEPRIQQENVINKVLSEFKNGKKYAIVDCGTGVGKSAIGLTIAQAINNSSEYPGIYPQGSYFLTTQKILQEQYEKDFSKNTGLVSLYSSSNYTCSIDKKSSCKDIQISLRSGQKNNRYEKCKYDCCYKKKKKDFIEKELGITNFSYFLTEKNYSKKIPNKKVLIIDEAHNLENELTRFIEISVSSYFSEKILKLKIPDSLNTQFKVFNWIKNFYHRKVIEKVSFINKQLEKLGISSHKLEEFKKITNHYDMLVSHEKKIQQFIYLYDKDNWVFEINNTDDKYKKFIFKPIDVSKYAKDYMLDYADYIVFMSATIISHEGFALTLGLPHDKIVSIKEESPFPAENKPIIFHPVGSMSYKSIDKNLPNLVKYIETILDNHLEEKGIIHTHSIKISKFVFNNISKKYKKRLLIAFGSDRDEVLKKHIKSKQKTVLLTPSMAEGVDLKGDLSKFQIICKIPFPFLGDKAVIKKMNKWKWWYDTQTIRTVIQSVGRSIRSEDDTAITYILDNDWDRVMKKSYKIIPDDFKKSYHEY